MAGPLGTLAAALLPTLHRVTAWLEAAAAPQPRQGTEASELRLAALRERYPDAPEAWIALLADRLGEGAPFEPEAGAAADTPSRRPTPRQDRPAAAVPPLHRHAEPAASATTPRPIERGEAAFPDPSPARRLQRPATTEADAASPQPPHRIPPWESAPMQPSRAARPRVGFAVRPAVEPPRPETARDEGPGPASPPAALRRPTPVRFLVGAPKSAGRTDWPAAPAPAETRVAQPPSAAPAPAEERRRPAAAQPLPSRPVETVPRPTPAWPPVPPRAEAPRSSGERAASAHSPDRPPVFAGAGTPSPSRPAFQDEAGLDRWPELPVPSRTERPPAIDFDHGQRLRRLIDDQVERAWNG